MKKKIMILIGNTRANRSLMVKSWGSKMEQKYIILGLGVVAVHAIIATLDMPDSVLERAKRAQDISDACASSTYITTPPATITALNGLISVYSKAATDARETAYRNMVNALKALMRTYQTAADLNVNTAEALIKSGGFGVKKITIKQKGKFTASTGTDSGTVDLTAEGSGAYTCHDWMYSADGIVFVRMAPTVAAKTQVTGLTPGQWAYFTHELVTKKGGQGVSQVLKIMVK